MKYIILLLFTLSLFTESRAVAPITGITHACIGGTTTLSDATSGGVWISGSPAIATISPIGIVYGVSAGTVVITYAVGASYAVTPVTIYSLPAVFALTGGGSYCAGDSGVHVGLAGSQTGVNYYLHIGASVIGPVSGTGAALDFGLQTAAGSYTATATNTTTTCSSYMTGSATVTTTPAVVPAVIITSPVSDTFCSGSVVSFAAIPVNGGPSPSYLWLVNGVAVGGDSTHYTYTPANGDIIAVQMVSDTACASPGTVYSNDTAIVLTTSAPSVSINASPGSHLCQGAAVLLMPAPAFGGTAPTYTWKKNGFYASGGSTYSFVPIDGDAVQCIVHSNYRCRTIDTGISTTMTLSVDSPVTPYVSIIATPGTTVGRGQYDTLRATVTNGGTSPAYQWFINEDTIHGAITDTYISDTFSAPYPDSVTCVVTGSGACRISAYTWAYIIVSTAGVGSNLSGDDIGLFPNPVVNSVAVTNAPGSTFQLVNVLGETLLTKKLSPNNPKQIIDLSGLPPGLYIARFADNTGNAVLARRLIKQ